MPSPEQQQERPAERNRPMPRGRRLRTDQVQQPSRYRIERQRKHETPRADHALTRRVPARGLATSSDVRTEQQRAECESAEEARNCGQNACGLVAQPQRALLRPHDLVAEPGAAGSHHQRQRRDSLVAHVNR